MRAAGEVERADIQRRAHRDLRAAGDQPIEIPTLGSAIRAILTGLASVGFPGTFGFVGTEMLVDGVVQAYPYAGIGVVIATTLAGIAVMKAYFRIFTGKHHVTTISLRRRPAERIAVLTLGTVILGGGILPQLGVASRHHAALEILEHRRQAADDRSNEPLRPSKVLHDVSKHSTPAVDRPSDTKTSVVLKYSR
jgi:NADH-quinone oxidoreductase subunit M